MATIGTTKIGCDFGSGSGGGGFPVPESGIVNIPADYPTITAVFDAIDAAGGMLGDERLIVQLPDTNGAPLEEYFRWRDKDYSKVTLLGAQPAHDFATSFSNLTGTAGDYRYTITASEAVCTAAALHGYVTVESSVLWGVEDHFKVLGTWEVESTTATTITVICTCQDSFTSLPTPTLDTFVTVMGTTMQSTIAGNDGIIFHCEKSSKSPLLAYICLVGNGTQYLLEATYSSEISSPLTWDNDFYQEFALTLMHTLVCNGASTGLAIRGNSKFTGAISISACTGGGFFAQSGSIYILGHIQVTGIAAWGCFISENCQMNIYGYAHFVGNSSYGLKISSISRGYSGYGRFTGNVSTDLICEANSDFKIKNSTGFLGTSSPAVNTIGNYNSYIFR